MNETQPEFKEFPKIHRYNRLVTVTEKLDGTNAQVYVTDWGDIFAGSRNRWLDTVQDNFGFAEWVQGNHDLLFRLGPGRHFGEWWGKGIQRGYGQSQKRFSLFNTIRWASPSATEHLPIPNANPKAPIEYQQLLPEGLDTVPEIWRGNHCDLTLAMQTIIDNLKMSGSWAAPGYMYPEGIVIFHVAANTAFKWTYEGDKNKG